MAKSWLSYCSHLKRSSIISYLKHQKSKTMVARLDKIRGCNAYFSTSPKPVSVFICPHIFLTFFGITVRCSCHICFPGVTHSRRLWESKELAELKRWDITYVYIVHNETGLYTAMSIQGMGLSDCNVVSYWVGLFPEWSLNMEPEWSTVWQGIAGILHKIDRITTVPPSIDTWVIVLMICFKVNMRNFPIYLIRHKLQYTYQLTKRL